MEYADKYREQESVEQQFLSNLNKLKSEHSAELQKLVDQMNELKQKINDIDTEVAKYNNAVKLISENYDSLIKENEEKAQKVKEKLEMRTESMGFQDYIFRVIIPETTEVEVKDGVKKEKVKKMFPGYVLVEMIMTDEAWYIVRNTPGVTGFIGSSGKGAKPTPLKPQEIDKILANMGMTRMDVDKELTVGTRVSIVDGPFKGMEGVIDNLDIENSRLTVLIDLFGQETPVEVELFQVSAIK